MALASRTDRHSSRLLLKLAVLGLLLTIATFAYAQNAPPTATPPAAPTPPAATDGYTIDITTGNLPSLLDLFMTSPIINGTILGLSALSLLLFLFLLITINVRAMVPADLVDELTKLVMRGKYEAVADLCRAHRRVFIATIVQRCAENAGKPHSVLMDMLDAEGRRRSEIIWNRISYLADIANITPMLGLLGTVVGMLTAFASIEAQAASLTSKVLAHGIGQAMSTTMFGLSVAIVTLVLYSFIKSRATQSLAEAEQAVHSIADHMKRAAPVGTRDREDSSGSLTPPLRPRPRGGAFAGDES